MFPRMGFDTGVDLDKAVDAAKFTGGVLGRQDTRHGEPRAEMAGWVLRPRWRATSVCDIKRWRCDRGTSWPTSNFGPLSLRRG
jgi:hypothetical protein